jgi:NAD(P)-dependent dehydrogenase (short-subunit alcohol dehydrogenase family)
MARLMADVGPAPLPHLGERLTGHVILVTGATGMAAAAAERMAAEGARMFVVARTDANAAGVAARIRAAGGEAQHRAADLADERAAQDPATVSYVARKQPLVGGLIPAEDIAAAAAYLLSDESRYLTGQLLVVDGGWSITDADPGDAP